MGMALQGSLLDVADRLELRPLGSGLHRTVLARGAWVDYRPGWLAGADELFDHLHHEVPWHAERREMYERMVDVPRLLKFYGEGEALPHPVLVEAREQLSRRYAPELGEPFEGFRRSFQKRRKIVVDGLNALPGVSCRMPGGAFYAFPNVKGTGRSSRDLASDLLTEAHVALIPGESFGDNGAGYLRLSYAASEAELKPAKISGTMAFMVESCWPYRPTRYALDRAQPDYDRAWADFPKAQLPK